MTTRTFRTIAWTLAVALAGASLSAARQNAGPPMVRDISFRSYPEIAGTYERGETVEVAVDFTAPVTVTGSPQLALIVGDEIRWATYSHNVRWTNFLAIRYTVQAADRDANGISIPADAIRLNGGSIRASPDGVIDAVLTHVGVPDNATHWVDGGRFTAPEVRSISFESSPGNGDTYEFGEQIRLAVEFNRTVVASPGVRLALAIGRQTRFADLSPRYDVPRCPPCGFYTQYFEYMVVTGDRDADGISVPANAFRLGDDGVIVAAVDRSVDALLTHAGIAPDPSRKVDGGRYTPPKVSSLSFSGYPLQGSTYELGEDIELVVHFDKAVTVEGGPQVALTIGGRTRQALFFPSGRTGLSFRYTVQTADLDADGISIEASSLSLNGGRIKALADGVADADLTHDAIASDARRRVDGSRVSVPVVRGISFRNPDTYERGETVSVYVGFTRAVTVTGSPQMALIIGNASRLATYSGGCASSLGLSFRYTVQATDRDGDGVSVGANAIRLNGGTIRAAADGTTDANLVHGPSFPDPSPRVDGGRATAPRVSLVRFWGPARGTYELGDTVEIEMEFDPLVTVTGNPVLELDVGGQTRLATHTHGLIFRYTVQASDRDNDGISIPANALRRNSGMIAKSSDGGATGAVLGHEAVPSDPERKVDGSRVTVPRVEAVRLGGGTRGLGDVIHVAVDFTKPVKVTGSPQLALTIGGRTRLATYSRGYFRYTVRATDRDGDGIGIPASAIRLNGGTIKAAADGSTDAELSHAAVDSGARVDGGRVEPLTASIFFGVSPRGCGTYERGETIWVGARLSRGSARDSIVSGRPQLALNIGSRVRLASYSMTGGRLGPPYVPRLGDAPNTLWFGYTVQAEDRDTDGISVPANAIRFDGGTIRLAVDGAPEEVPTSNALIPDRGRRVDGGRVATPTVSDISLSRAPEVGDTYRLGETIAVEARFTREVTVTGNPQIALTVGDRTRAASVSPGPFAPARTLSFEYTVQPGDLDTDGVSVAADSLRLNGGAIRLADGVLDAALSHSGLTDDAVHKVDGSRVVAPTVYDVSLRGSPAGGDSYQAGETIEVEVGFSQAVTVTGDPQVVLTMGDATRLATHFSGPQPYRALSFGYTVQPGDRDEDGVSISANALRLNGGTIRLADGVTNAVLAHSAVGDDPDRKVRGGGSGGDTCPGRPQPPDQDPPSSGPPTAGFTAGAKCVNGLFRERTGVEVAFTDTSTGTVTTRHWDFGDGATSSAERPRHDWAVPGFYRVSLTVSDGETSSTAFHDVLVEASDPAGTCKPDAETRCLQDSRYEVRAVWWERDGRSGPARVAHAGTNDSALFWFFDLSNWEILVKVLDGCSTNGHFWVFGGATTDLGYRITVTDTVTDRARVYGHEGGPPAPAITDSTAFQACAR